MKKKKVFISYCHKDTTDKWINKLVTILGQYGIECIVDIYDLKYGQDINSFMEQIKNVDKVLMLLGKEYKEKANERKGGVGAETQIISNDVYNDVEQTKFIPIVIEKDENERAYLPCYLESRLFADFSDENLFNANIQSVINQINDMTTVSKPNIVLENTDAVKILKEYVVTWSKRDFHYEDKKKDIEKIYDFYRSNYNQKRCSMELIDIGYLLTDIFDREYEYDKSLEITTQILKYYEVADLDDFMLNKEYIRKMIGCAYGLAISKVNLIDQKSNLLEQSQHLFETARRLCENYEDCNENDSCSKMFLWGIYYSDYGAYLLNKGDLYKTQQRNDDAKKAYNLALEYYNKSLEKREGLLTNIRENDKDIINEIRNTIARCISNMGSALFRLEKYNDSIKKHREALKIYINLEDKDREYRTKEYIIGSSIKLWEQNHNNLLYEDFKQCQLYMEELLCRYGNTERLANSKNRMIKIKEYFIV